MWLCFWLDRIRNHEMYVFRGSGGIWEDFLKNLEIRNHSSPQNLKSNILTPVFIAATVYNS